MNYDDETHHNMQMSARLIDAAKPRALMGAFARYVAQRERYVCRRATLFVVYFAYAIRRCLCLPFTHAFSASRRRAARLMLQYFEQARDMTYARRCAPRNYAARELRDMRYGNNAIRHVRNARCQRARSMRRYVHAHICVCCLPR